MAEALEGTYGGSVDSALLSLEELSAAHPQDPIGPYLEALVFAWKIESQPESSLLDQECVRRADGAIALAQSRLQRDSQDARALLALGAAHGVKSRLALFRGDHGRAASEAVAMRTALLKARAMDPASKDVLFGLGLYDYFVDVLPRFARVLRFLSGMPGGNRLRGLSSIEEARTGSVFHRSEALAQLSQIHAVYERSPDEALGELRELRIHYPGSPLWGLRLAALEGESLGLFQEAERVSEEILNASQRREPNYAPIVGLMARVQWGEALLGDLRLPEARRVLAPALDGDPEAPWIAPRAEWILGRSLELSGDREGALEHYRAARLAAKGEDRRRAESAIASPLTAGEVRGAARISVARRLREAGRKAEARQAFEEALRLWPDSQEALLRAAEADLEEGRIAAARGPLEKLAGASETRPPFVRPWSHLLLARVLDAGGDRGRALREYKEVYEHPCGDAWLRERAQEGLERPYATEEAPETRRPPE
jgi:tetratricopeptide (TPR) repeat protein